MQLIGCLMVLVGLFSLAMHIAQAMTWWGALIMVAVGGFVIALTVDKK